MTFFKCKYSISCLVAFVGVFFSASIYAAVDLVYVPVEPCRIADTRSTIGVIPADSSVNLLAYGGVGELTGQGGSPGGCPNPKPGSTPVSIAANVTAVGNQATGNGNLVAYPYDSTAPTASLLNYKVGTNIANSTIIALCEGDTCTYDFNLQSNISSVPAIVDVQGYFYPKAMKNVITVSAENADYTNPIDAINAIPTTGSDAPSPTNPYLIEIGPGTYNLGSNQLVMRDWIDIKGTGSREATILTGAVSSSSISTAAAVVVGADNTELTNLTIKNTSTGTVVVAIANDGTSPKMRSIKARATSGGSDRVGVYNNNASPLMSSVNTRASGGLNNYGVYNNNADPRMKSVNAEALNGTNNVAVYNTGALSEPGINALVAEANGGTGTNIAFQVNSGASPIILSSFLDGEDFGIFTDGTSSLTITSSALIGGAGGSTANNNCFFITDGINILDNNCLTL